MYCMIDIYVFIRAHALSQNKRTNRQLSSPYKLGCKSTYRTESTVFDTANRCD